MMRSVKGALRCVWLSMLRLCDWSGLDHRVAVEVSTGGKQSGNPRCLDNALSIDVWRVFMPGSPTLVQVSILRSSALLQSSHGEDTKYYDIGDRRRSPPRYERSILERLHKVRLVSIQCATLLPCQLTTPKCTGRPSDVGTTSVLDRGASTTASLISAVGLTPPFCKAAWALLKEELQIYP